MFPTLSHTLLPLLLASLALAAPCCELRKKGLPVVPASPAPANPANPTPGNITLQPPAPRQGPGFAYGSTPVRGVNLGGWLVLEPWITPSIFDNTGNNGIVDEWTFGQYQDYNTALSTLQAHWSSWIVEGDFAQMAAAGLNHVRIPIGFWAFDNSGTPLIQANQYDMLKQAVTWAREYGIKVWVDLHGVPGSQNGYDNSGQRGAPTWQDPNTSNVARTQSIISTLSQEFSQSQYYGTVTAIELVNEPAGYLSSDILDCARQYYSDAYSVVRGDGSLVVVLHDAFQELSYWDGFLTPSAGASNTLMDTHIYQVFNDAQLQYDWPTHISNACQNGPKLYSYASQNIWTVVGEWSTASTDCATYLNGRGVGARYDGTFGDGNPAIGSCTSVTGSRSGFSSDYKTFLRQFWEAQVTAYEEADGWIYWCWKNENADDWSYQAGLTGGWIPADPSQRDYPNICSS